MNRDLADVPSDRVVALPDAEIDPLAMLIAHDHVELAAVVHRPASRHAMPADFVHAVVDRLEQVAVELLPAWLPEAAEGFHPDTAGLAAIRAAAAARARRERYPGVFLPDLASFAVTTRRAATTPLPLRTRAAALARLVSDAFGRRKLVLLVEPAGADRDVVAAGAGWLVHQGGPTVWLIGDNAAKLDGVPQFWIEPPLESPDTPNTGRTVVGKPHPASTVEMALEAALAAESWSAGRVWNQSYQSHTLAQPVRLDLLWPDERCVVEIDGPEHCRPVRFEADRQRDVQLQLDGFAVLRFTNARVTHDVGAVVQQIGSYLRTRRRDIAEGRHHGRR